MEHKIAGLLSTHAKRLIQGLIVACLAMIALPAGAVVAPGSDPFYQPPKHLQEGGQGSLIRWREIQPAGVTARAWQILYQSTDARDKPIVVSGTVFVPTGSGHSADRPVIAWAPGTHGIADVCAPSYQYVTGTDYEVSLGVIPETLARGWSVVVTDYQGLGTPGDHTYVVGRAEGHAVLDAVRAARALPAAGISARAPVGIMGYSQGGHAAAWAAQLHEHYAPELRVEGVATGAGPARIDEAFAYADNGVSPLSAVIPYILVGANAAYPELRLDDILTPYGKAVVADVRQGKCLLDVLSAYSGMTDAVLVEGAPILQRKDWRTRLQQSRTGAVAPDMPALFFASPSDQLVPYANSSKLFGDWCAKGAKVALRQINAPDHLEALSDGWPFALDWMADRFAGLPAPSDCK